MLELRNEDGTWPCPKGIIEITGEGEQQVDGTSEEKEEMVLGDGIVGLYNMG
jgi:hypothetical protein